MSPKYFKICSGPRTTLYPDIGHGGTKITNVGKRSYLAETFFRGSHLTTKVFLMSYWWAMKYGRQEDWMREFNMGPNTIVDWRNFFRDVCAQYFLDNPVMLGGPGD